MSSKPVSSGSLTSLSRARAAANTRLPHFVFIARAHPPPRPSLCDAWRSAIARYFPTESEFDSDARRHLTVREGSLLEVEPRELRCDCIVSPANSFGIMDGGFDLDLSQAFQGSSADMYYLTDHVQSQLHARWGGFAPAGSCTLIPLPRSVSGPGNNRWGTHTLAVIPTMKRPEEVRWNRELAYNGMWALLNEIARWNEHMEGQTGTRRSGEWEDMSRISGQGRIERVVMTGFGTGAGGVSAERCGQQMILAVKHFMEGVPEKLRWEGVGRRVQDIEDTIRTTSDENND